MFWDSSALVPVIVPEPRSGAITALLAADEEPVIWWTTPLECQSALRRRHREAPWPANRLAAATERFGCSCSTPTRSRRPTICGAGPAGCSPCIPFGQPMRCNWRRR